MNIPDDIKKEAEEALKEHEGGSLSLWDVPHNAQEREYWKEVWTLGRMKSIQENENMKHYIEKLENTIFDFLV